MSLRPHVDAERCILTGTCEALAPTLFRLDDDGTVHVLATDLDDAQLALAREAADTCPSRALSLQDR